MKKASEKDAKFFCESCGSEVPRNSKTCPTCGKFFLSVRCPKCGHTGSNDDFKAGCPACGYAVKGANGALGLGNSNIKSAKNSKRKSARTRGGLFGALNLGARASGSASGASSVDASLPFWVYMVSICVLAVLVVCLYSCL